MKVAITGSRGFIGSHLLMSLPKEWEIKEFDLKNGEEQDIRHITPEDFKGVDYVFHLAAQAKVPLSIDDPLMTHDHNVNGTLNVLWCAKEAGVKRVIYSASSSAYGTQDTLPLVETMKPNPMSPYGVQKLLGEYYCKVFSEIYGLETVSLRYFNVYGPNMPLNGAYSACVAKFLDAKKNNVPMTIYGGKQTRDFTYVGDVVRANLSAMYSPLVGQGEIINIGSGRNHSILDVAKAIGGEYEIEPQRTGEPMDTRADIRKAKVLLEWQPTMDLLEWLKS